MTSGEPSFIHVTVVAGESVEVQVSVNESGSKVRLVMLGGANKTMRYQRSNILVDADNQLLMESLTVESIPVHPNIGLHCVPILIKHTASVHSLLPS